MQKDRRSPLWWAVLAAILIAMAVILILGLT
jgi:hypothetical protein